MESVLPPDVARKLPQRVLLSLVKRVHKGKKLTRAERTPLQNLAAAPAGHSGPTHASNDVELPTLEDPISGPSQGSPPVDGRSLSGGVVPAGSL